MFPSVRQDQPQQISGSLLYASATGSEPSFPGSSPPTHPPLNASDRTPAHGRASGHRGDSLWADSSPSSAAAAAAANEAQSRSAWVRLSMRGIHESFYLTLVLSQICGGFPTRQQQSLRVSSFHNQRSRTLHNRPWKATTLRL